MLLDNSADIEMRTDYGGTALWSAARNGHTDVLDALIARGANVNQSINIRLIKHVKTHAYIYDNKIK